MKNYLEARREELRKRDDKGFALMEMLIVVAIIAVLIAIAIPVFTNQLERSREATDAANIRSAYADIVVQYLDDPDNATPIDVASQQQVADWQGGAPSLTYESGGEQNTYEIPACTAAGQTYTVDLTIDEATGTVEPNISVA